MGYYMISENDVRKEQFDNQVAAMSKDNLTIEQYLMLFGAILGFACDFEFVSSNKKTQIEKNILEAFQEIENAVLIVNTMYVFSMYLQQLKPSVALDKLLRVESVYQARLLFSEADIWFKTEVRKMSGILNILRPKIVKLNNSPITGAFTEFNNEVNSLMGYNSNPNINLKRLHINFCIQNVKASLDYMFLEEDKNKAHNYLKFLRTRIENFFNEISIIVKLNGEYALNYLENVQKNFTRSDEAEAFAIEAAFQKRLDEAKAAYDEKMEEARKFEAWIATLSEEKFSEIPVEEFGKYDEISIENVYKKTKNQILEEWNSFDERSMNKDRDCEFSEKDYIWFQTTHPGLVFLAKEFAICFFAEQGILDYPSDVLTKVKLSDNISTVLAVWVLLGFAEKLSLTEGEIGYLKKYYENNGGDIQKGKDFEKFKSILEF